MALLTFITQHLVVIVVNDSLLSVAGEITSTNTARIPPNHSLSPQTFRFHTEWGDEKKADDNVFSNAYFIHF